MTEVAAYQSVLTEAGFTYSHDDKAGDKYYLSSDGKYLASPYKDSSKANVMHIYLVAPKKETPAWPNAAINAQLASMGCNDALPAYTGEYNEVQAGIDPYSGNFAIYVFCDNPSEAYADYAYDIYLQGFIYCGSNSYGDYYLMSPNEEYLITVMYSSTGFAIYLEKNEETPPDDNESKFPMDAVKEVYSDADGVLPALEDERGNELCQLFLLL